MASAKTKDKIRVINEVKVDRKGKGKEPPLGMGKERKDLKILLKVRNWVQGLLEDFEIGEMG